MEKKGIFFSYFFYLFFVPKLEDKSRRINKSNKNKKFFGVKLTSEIKFKYSIFE